MVACGGAESELQPCMVSLVCICTSQAAGRYVIAGGGCSHCGGTLCGDPCDAQHGLFATGASRQGVTHSLGDVSSSEVTSSLGLDAAGRALQRALVAGLELAVAPATQPRPRECSGPAWTAGVGWRREAK